MNNKLKLIGSVNEGKRNVFILSKEKKFISLFPLFLINCGFKDIGIYEDYQEEEPDMNNLTDKIQHFQNEEYDIDLVYTLNRIILIIRTEVNNREKLILKIKYLVNLPK